MNLFGYDHLGSPVSFYAVREFFSSAKRQAPPPSAVKPAHHIMILDLSGSMYLDVDQAKEMLAKVICAEEFQAPHLRLSLVTYASKGDVVIHFAHVPAASAALTDSDAMKQIKKLRTRGATCISQALTTALGLIRPDETTVVSLHTDGWANDPSSSSEAKALRGLAAQIRSKGAWLSAIAYRTSADYTLLAELAAIAGGSSVQAVGTRQVYDAIHSGASRAAGPQAPLLTVTAPAEGSFHLFLSRSARRVEILETYGSISGLRPDDDVSIWTLRGPLPASAGSGPDDVDLTIQVALARALLARRDLRGAKQVLYGFGAGALQAEHGRALTPEALSKFAAALDAILFEGAEVIYDSRRGLGVSAYRPSLLQILGILAEAPAGAVLVDVPHLLSAYSARGIKRVPGQRTEDGTLIPPPVRAVPRTDDSPWAAVHSVTLSNAAADAALTVTQPIDLVKVADDKPIRRVAGIDLTGLKSYRALTVIADGASTVPALRLLVSHAEVRSLFYGLGLVDVNHGSVVNDPFMAQSYHLDDPRSLNHVFEIKLDQHPVITMKDDSKPEALAAAARDLLGLATLDKIAAELLKGTDSAAYTPEQIAALKEVCVTEKLYFSPPSTEAHPNMEEAIQRGEVDSRTVFKIDFGLPALPRGASDLYGGNEGFARYFVLTGEATAKPTLRALLEGKKAAVKPPGRAKVNAADEIQRSIFEAVVLPLQGEKAPAGLPMMIASRADGLVSAARASEARRRELLAREARLISSELDARRAALRPVLWTAAATGMLPDGLAAEMLDAEGYRKAFPAASVPKSQEGSSFFCVPSVAACQVVITVTPETKRYTVRLPAHVAPTAE